MKIVVCGVKNLLEERGVQQIWQGKYSNVNPDILARSMQHSPMPFSEAQ